MRKPREVISPSNSIFFLSASRHLSLSGPLLPVPLTWHLGRLPHPMCMHTNLVSQLNSDPWERVLWWCCFAIPALFSMMLCTLGVFNRYMQIAMCLSHRYLEMAPYRTFTMLKPPKASGVRHCLKLNSTFCLADPAAFHTVDSPWELPSQKCFASRACGECTKRQRTAEATGTTQLLPQALGLHSPALVHTLLRSLLPKPTCSLSWPQQRELVTYISKRRFWESASVP